jgi:hypothetical protein
MKQNFTLVRGKWLIQFVNYISMINFHLKCLITYRIKREYHLAKSNLYRVQHLIPAIVNYL